MTITVTGGTYSTDGTYGIRTFNSSTDLVVSGGSLDVEYLLIAGGAGGGAPASVSRGAGGGGAGGLLNNVGGTKRTLSAATYPIEIGAGGASTANGSNSTFDGLASIGGGTGGYTNSDPGTDGGSGGGGQLNNGGAGTAGQGNDGGNSTSNSRAAGGGGAGAVGLANTGTHGGAGGAGVANSISGSSVTYAGGGGGGGTANGGAGGSGGGGAGGGNSDGTAGTANTGGGGGGGGGTVGGETGGVGGAGVFIVRYLLSDLVAGGDARGSFLITHKSTPSYKSGFYAPGRGGVAAYPELWEGCVGAWNPGLGLSGSVLRDWSGRNNHGDLKFDAKFEVIGGNYLISLDGAGDYINFGDKPIYDFGNKDFSVAIWFKITSGASGFLINNNVSSSSSGYDAYLSVGQKLTFRVRDTASNNVSAITTPAYDDGVLHHFCLIRKGNTASIWVDGVFSATDFGTIGDTDSVGQPLNVGARNGSNTMTGGFGGLSLYNRVLSPNEIRLLARRPGIAYERKRRVRASTQTALTFNPAWIRSRSCIIQ